MAERRMFAKTIIDSDAFLDMPLSTQCLYFHLSMRADDDGFINNPKKIQRMIAASEDDLKLLVLKKFIIPFESGIVVIKHWKIHNYIRSDRYKETVYQEEKSSLELKDNNAYTICQPLGIPNDSQEVHRLDTQDRLGKDSIGEDSIYINTMCNSDESHDAKSPSKSAINDLFERVWKLYPNKKGKGQVSDAKKKKLYEVGYDELERAIDRYKEELKQDADWRKPQNGSTFFNSGFIDYLDKNYEPREKVAVNGNKTAQQLDEFYNMAAEWAEGSEEG